MCRPGPRLAHKQNRCRDADARLMLFPFLPGGWRAEKSKPMASAFVSRCGGRLPARHLRRLTESGLPLARPSRSNRPEADSATRRAQAGQRPIAQHQDISQLLAGTPNGPGGSSNAARVHSCVKARGRCTPSRHRNASRERPLEGRGGSIVSEVWRAGISAQTEVSLVPRADIAEDHCNHTVK